MMSLHFVRNVVLTSFASIDLLKIVFSNEIFEESCEESYVYHATALLINKWLLTS